MRKIGIFGGTFNPVHKGHLSALRAAAEMLDMDKILVIPTADPPHKKIRDLAPPEQRLEMLERALAGVPYAEVSDIELRRGGRSYTADTVASVRELYPDAEIWLMMGDDMLVSFEQWKNFDWLKQSVSVCTLSRFADGSEAARAAEKLRREYAMTVTELGNNPIEISSSELRAQLKKRGGIAYLESSVYEYIIEHGLYGAVPDLDWLRLQAYGMLAPKRILHVAGCECEASRLAKRWGADVTDAKEAAILHDITKTLDINEQLLLCEKYGIITDNVEKNQLKLLHSKTGAEIARRRFSASERVCSAIFWHTTGKEDMTLLEKIIYMADYIEPTRSFEGVDRLRTLAYEDLDKALLLGLEMSLEELRSKGIEPHIATAAAAGYLKRRIKQ